MTIEQKILSKLEPHAKRIRDGEGNDFDYLPAVLLQVLERQQHQVKLTGDTVILLSSIEKTVIAMSAQSRTQITSFEDATQRKMEEVETAIKDMRTQLQNSQMAASEQIAVYVGAHQARAIQTNEGLSAIDLRIESFSVSSKRSSAKFMRFLIAGLIGSVTAVGLAIAILQRH